MCFNYGQILLDFKHIPLLFILVIYVAVGRIAIFNIVI